MIQTGSPRAESPGPGLLYGTYLAIVESVDDPEQLARVEVRLLGFDGVGAQDGPIWARVALPYAGPSLGAFMLPSKGAEVVVQFAGGDPRHPIVIGSLWNGNHRPTEQLGGDGKTVDRWTLTGKDGSRIAIVEEQSGQAKISLSTPGNVSATLQQTSGGSLELSAANSTITIDSQGVTIRTQAKLTVQASQVQITASTIDVNAAISTFNGIVKATVVQASTVIANTYTPGAGNVW